MSESPDQRPGGSEESQRSPSVPVTAPSPGPHIARPDRVFRIKRYIVVALIVGFGAASAYHGFVSWPRETAQRERIDTQLAQEPQGSPEALRLLEEQKQYAHHSDTDILFNRVMALVLPPLGLFLLARWLYMSRGEIRLDEGDVLHSPGHPPIPVASIRSLDDALWSRKGIAFVEFEGPSGAGQVRLDHDWYQPRAIHAIHDRLKYLLARRGGTGED